MSSDMAVEVNLSTLPVRMAGLPVDPRRGVPVPWFVAWINGEPEFRVVDPQKWECAVRERLCWVCGKRLGAYLVFILGPMCTITRTSAEPPCHLECALWSARNCPFLARPHMIRRQHQALIEQGFAIAGNSIDRNPGVTALWVCRSYRTFRPPDGGAGMLINVGEPEEVLWMREGRDATRAEVEESIRTGLPTLEAEALKEKGGIEDLRSLTENAKRWLPNRNF